MWEESFLLISGKKKKKWEKEEKLAGQVKQNRFPVAQGLDSPLACYERDESWVLKQRMS